MKKLSVILMIILATGIFAGNDKNKQTEKKINDLLAKMTLEEKIGQMTQVTLEVVIKERKNEKDPAVPEVSKLRDAILKYKVGSILNTGGAANTVDNWHEIITSIQQIAMNESRMKIPVIYGIDAIHGANYTVGATLFPQSVTMAATRNTELLKQSAAVTAHQVKVCGIKWNFNPVLDMGRQPLWPRMWETFGEDPYLISEMGKAYIEGYQGDPSKLDNIACLKHYLGYGVPVNGRDRTPALIPERYLREIHLTPFKEAIKKGALSVMVNSSEINGIPTHANYHVLTEILKNELKFEGFVVSDWEDIKRLYTRDRVASSPKEAVKMAVMAGVDMSMVPYDYSFYELLLQLVNEKQVPVKRIDDAVRRILRVKMRIGLFENYMPDAAMKNSFDKKEFETLNYGAAAEAITLLKNNSVLPLDKTKKYFVTGPTANLLKVLNSGWTITWQGEKEELYPAEKMTVLEAIENKVGKNNVIYSAGTDFSKDINLTESVELAKTADAVILCLGENTYCEAEGNINDLTLDAVQLEYAKKLAATGKPVVLVLLEGRPRLITSINDKMSAIVLGYLPGLEGGRAITDVLFGDINPSGKLPYSYPKNPNGFTTYDYKPIEASDPKNYEHLYPFGHGLSYTTFSYGGLKLNKPVISGKDNIEVSVNVTNTGKVKGKEAVELYLSDLFASVSRPVKQLKRFTKIELNPGETKTVVFTLNQDDLAFVGLNDKWITEPGKFEIYIEKLKTEFELK